jgi:hypothetical protein
MPKYFLLNFGIWHLSYIDHESQFSECANMICNMYLCETLDIIWLLTKLEMTIIQHFFLLNLHYEKENFQFFFQNNLLPSDENSPKK